MQFNNAGICKSLVYGAIIGLLISIVLDQLLLWTVDQYYYLDEFDKLVNGGGYTACVLGVLWMTAYDVDELYSLNFWTGLLLIVGCWTLGAIIAIFFAGFLAIFYNVLGTLGIFDHLLENLPFGFWIGGTSVGLFVGLLNYFKKSATK